MTKKTIHERYDEIKKRVLDDKRINGMMKPWIKDYDEETRELTVSFLVEEWMLNPGDVLHGGLLATAFDIALGCHTLLLEHEKSIVTTDMSMQFLEQVPLGSTLIIRSKVNREGGRLVSLYGEAFAEGHPQVAGTALATYMKLR